MRIDCGFAAALVVWADVGSAAVRLTGSVLDEMDPQPSKGLLVGSPVMVDGQVCMSGTRV